ncbi:MAG: N-acetylmuramoyl-L-alanine amidase [Verrucomicrobiota bacterium]
MTNDRKPDDMDITRRGFNTRICAGTLLTSFSAASASAATYIVGKGDTLTQIGRRYGTTARALRSANHLSSDTILVGQKLTVPAVSKEMSAVRKATNRIKLNRRKWKYIVVHHSATSSGNAESFDRVHRKRGMQNGLAYHFVIGNGRDSGDGEIEIGRRWTRQLSGGHVGTWKYNAYGIGICLVGNFEKQKPTHQQITSLKELIGYLGVDLLDGKYKFLVHREINPTLCPGRNFPTREMHRIFG